MLRTSNLVLVAALAAVACQNTRKDEGEQRNEPQNQPRIEQPQGRAEPPAMGRAPDNNREDALKSAKQDYRGRVDAVLTDLDKHVSELKNRKGSIRDKNLIDEQINNLNKRKDTLDNDKKLIEKATPDTWPTIRDQIDKDMRDTRAMFAPAGKT